MRVTKDPVIRKQELVLAACELFKKNGFEQVSVSDIVQKVGVAQGTFYYYFKTKYDMLNAVMDLYMQETMVFIERVADDKNMSPVEKLQAIIGYSLKQDPCENNFIEYLHTDENLVAHQKYMMKAFELTIPLVTDIVEAGVKDGLFNVRHPRETVELMVYMYGHLNDSLAITLDKDEYDRKIRATEDIFVRVLGIKDGSIRLDSYNGSWYSKKTIGNKLTDH